MTWQLIIVSDVPLGGRCATRAVQKSFSCSTSQVLEGVKLLSPHNVAQMDQADLPYGPFDVESCDKGGGLHTEVGVERTRFSNHPWS